MISQGHNLKDIRQYTLAQFGVHIRAAVNYRKSVYKEQLWQGWAAANASEKGIKQLLGTDSFKESKRVISVEESNKNWMALANMFGGLQS